METKLSSPKTAQNRMNTLSSYKSGFEWTWEIHPVKVIFTNFVQTTISPASNGHFQKSKIMSLECLIGPRSIKSKKAKTGVLKFAQGVTYSEYLSWHVANTLVH